jgi:disulfide bond formation protein DsbB
MDRTGKGSLLKCECALPCPDFGPNFEEMIACIRHASHPAPSPFSAAFLPRAAGRCSRRFIRSSHFGLEPCVLCLYQRAPFYGAIILSLTGLAMRANEKAVRIILGLCALLFLINAGIAGYHTGVEQQWWASAVEGCAVPDFSKDPSLWEKILTSPAASCSDIAWKDPVLGLSMANWNILYCLGLFVGCVVALIARRRPEPSAQP